MFSGRFMALALPQLLGTARGAEAKARWNCRNDGRPRRNIVNQREGVERWRGGGQRGATFPHGDRILARPRD
jgi:hypothetical protein